MWTGYSNRMMLCYPHDNNSSNLSIYYEDHFLNNDNEKYRDPSLNNAVREVLVSIVESSDSCSSIDMFIPQTVLLTLLGILLVYYATKLTAKWGYKAHVHSAFIGTLGGDKKKNPKTDAQYPQGFSLDEIVSRCHFDPEEMSDFTMTVAGIENLPPVMRKETLRNLKITVCEKVIAHTRSLPSVVVNLQAAE